MQADAFTQATLWVESSPGAEDFQPLAINHGSGSAAFGVVSSESASLRKTQNRGIAVFHGTLCRHKARPGPERIPRFEQRN